MDPTVHPDCPCLGPPGRGPDLQHQDLPTLVRLPHVSQGDEVGVVLRQLLHPAHDRLVSAENYNFTLMSTIILDKITTLIKSYDKRYQPLLKRVLFNLIRVYDSLTFSQ